MWVLLLSGALFFYGWESAGALKRAESSDWSVGGGGVVKAFLPVPHAPQRTHSTAAAPHHITSFVNDSKTNTLTTNTLTSCFFASAQLRNKRSEPVTHVFTLKSCNIFMFSLFVCLYLYPHTDFYCLQTVLFLVMTGIYFNNYDLIIGYIYHQNSRYCGHCN